MYVFGRFNVMSWSDVVVDDVRLKRKRNVIVIFLIFFNVIVF